MRTGTWMLAVVLAAGCDDGGEGGESGPIIIVDQDAGAGEGGAGGVGGDGGVGGEGGEGGVGGDDGAGGVGGEGGAGGGARCDGHPVLGCGEDAVAIEIIGTREQGLNTPRDLAFDPENPNRLWVVNRADDSTSIWLDVTDSAAEVIHRRDPFAEHFMEEVSSVAFGAPGTFGTCQESDNRYNGQAAPNGFMGPSLWSSDLEVYGFSNPEAVRAQGFDLGSHLDMLHESPFCMGIEWSHENAYWIFEGATSSLMLADFKVDHGVGWDDHSDGIMVRWVEGQVSRTPDVPSHLALDRDTGWLYIADTGNGRVGRFDTNVEGRVQRWLVVEPGTRLGRVSNAGEVETLTDAVERPSGLELHDGLLFVSDNATSEVSAWTLEGELVDSLSLDIAPGGLMGITFDADGRLYAVDAIADQLIRVSPE